MISKTAFQKLPIKNKLIRLILMISFFSLFLTTIISAVYEIYLLNNSLTDKLNVVASAIAHDSTAAVTYQQVESAKEILESANAEKDIEFSAIYYSDDTLFTYNINPEIKIPVHIPTYLTELSPEKDPKGVYFTISGKRWFMDVFYPIVVEDQKKATLFMRSNLNKAFNRLISFLLAMLVIMSCMMIVIYLVASHFQKLITEPLYALAETANRIANDKDYSIRMEQQSNDEIGSFIEAFNQMLSVIQLHESELSEQRKQLSIQVADRTRELANERDKALAATEAKSQFLANMSHEIRTPMNALIGMLSLLNKAALKSEYKSYLETAIFSSENLMKLINDVLDFSKIEAGKISFENIDFDLYQILSKITQLFTHTAGQKNLNLVFNFDPQINPVVNGDPTRLNQIIVNLVNNAIKFTSQGEVTIQLDLLNRFPNSQQIKFSVTDTGIGIEEKDLSRLFQSFTQLDGSTTRKYGGTGLGLTLSKTLIELMGGTIHVQSKPGIGSTFWFNLELQNGAITDTSTIKTETTELENTLSHFDGKILITDDDPVNRTVALAMLKSLGLNADTASDGVQALKMVNQQHYHLILMDCQMPKMDGYATTQKIRQIQNYPITIIGLTANVLVSDKQKCLDAGMDDYLPKPITLESFKHCIVKWLPDTDDEKKETLHIEKSIWNIPETVDHMLNNESLLSEIIDIFLNQYQQSLDTIDQAFIDQDFTTLRNSIHAFKGSTMHFTTPDLHQLIEHLEQQVRDRQSDNIEPQLNQLHDLVEKFVQELKRYKNDR